MVACVVKVDRESLKCLDQNGSIRTVLPTQVANKITPRRDAVATDRNGAEIRHGDTVREMYGEQRNGVILHIHRSFLFLHNKAQAENAGIIVVRTTNILTVSAKGGRSTGPDLTKMNPALMGNGIGRGAGAGGPGMPPPKSFGRDRMLGKTVLVRKGPFKGLVGIVKDSTDVQARVELHSKSKLVTIPKELLVVKEYVASFRCLLLPLVNISQPCYWTNRRCLPWERWSACSQRCLCCTTVELERRTYSYGSCRLFQDTCMGRSFVCTE